MEREASPAADGRPVELPVGPFDDTQTNEYKERGDYEGFHYGLSSYKTKVVKRLPHPRESNWTCLSWNPYRGGQIVSCGSDGTWAVHDAFAALQLKPTEGAKSVLACEMPTRLNSCCWAAADILIAAAEDSVASLWDIRQAPKEPIGKVTCKGSPINCLATTPLKPELFVCGGDDGLLQLYDRRRLCGAVHTLEGPSAAVHTLEGPSACKVSAVSFSLQKPSFLLSGDSNKYTFLWDLEKAGEEQDPEDAEDGPPELLLVASVANDNQLHIWQPKGSVFFEEESEREEDADELE
ncbi:WD domain, G-beta repeat domain containing protein, putative [Eimeria necatrix]|uniref:WD domain, G-beta repeat domain containing protein, putative n=1 Tax=Eimeria necatrix TaxID=51315 RepID=U6MK19_9EIME|nr:WD domain, G-beta repeat domain containing protein, putative [Eimeria necatrix]CDJ64552.1 WD domain, G-beta repeat domain containing protein, putative [Eimeria necatrix]